MSKIRDYAYLAAMSLAYLGGKNLYDEDGYFERTKFHCYQCKNFPQGNKTYCKCARHCVSKNTPADKCKNFVNNC